MTVGSSFTDWLPLSHCSPCTSPYLSGICGIWGMRHTLRMSYFLKPAPVASLNLLASFVRLCECVSCVACVACSVLPLGPLPSYWKASVSYFYRATLSPFLSVGEAHNKKWHNKMCHQVGWLLLFISMTNLFKASRIMFFRLGGYFEWNYK